MGKESTLHSTVLALLQAASTSSTEEHKTPGVFGTDDLHYFLDLDMAILGSSPEHYVEYTSIVRREYAFLSDNMYRSLRLKTHCFVDRIGSTGDQTRDFGI
uniref:Uncharacterized protein n=1 Tax=Timema cristinae TaxID=61476 RepID=A0A7R9GW86_TIMCR|nr:unnamed protein product [Timema cristinae]